MAYIIALSVFLMAIGLYLVYALFLKNIFNPISRAEHHLDKGDIDSAIKEYLKALEKKPTEISLRYKIAKLYEKKGDNDMARKQYGLLVGNTRDIPGLTEDMLNKKIADLSFEIKDYPKALKFYLMLLRSREFENDAYIKMLVGKILFFAGEYGLAISYLEEAKTRASSDKSVLSFLAYSYFLSEQYAYAVSILESLLSENQNDIKILYAYTLCLGAAKMYKQASEQAQILLDKSLDFPYKYYIERALAYYMYKQDNLDQAIIINQKTKEYLKIYENIEDEMRLTLDSAFYNYFKGNINKSIEDFRISFQFNLDFKYLREASIYCEKMKKIVDISKVSSKPLTKRELNDWNILISDEEEESWEEAIDEWEKRVVNYASWQTLASLDKAKTFDARSIISASKLQELLEQDDIRRKALEESKGESILRSKAFDFPLKDFATICANVVRNKLDHSILEEFYESGISTFADGDGVDFICYTDETKKDDLVYISFRRWKSKTVGELVLREYLALLKDKRIEHAMLIMPGGLNKAASNLVRNMPNISVYCGEEFTKLFKGEIIY